MFSPEARAAMASETRGQNSWLNFGPNGEVNRTAGVEDTVFADQKAGLMDNWAIYQNTGVSRGRLQRFLGDVGGDGADRLRELSGAIENGRLKLTHFAREQLSSTDPSKYGRGLARRSPEAQRALDPNFQPRTSFGIGQGDDLKYKKEQGLGNVANETEIPIEQMYDWGADPDGFRAAAKASGIEGNAAIATAAEKAVADAGYSGYWANNKSLGLVAQIFDGLEMGRKYAVPIAAGTFGAAATLAPEEAEAGGLGKAAGLAKDFASRMKRADVDYEPDNFYHGTAADIDEFQPSKSGNLGAGVYLTPSAESASKRAMLSRFRNRDKGKSPNVMQTRVRKDLNYMDVNENPFMNLDVEKLKSQGYDGVRRFENGELQEVNVFDPSNIRSTNADFDPAKKSSANLMAGVGGAALLASGLAPEEVQADEVMAEDLPQINKDTPSERSFETAPRQGIDPSLFDVPSEQTIESELKKFDPTKLPMFGNKDFSQRIEGATSERAAELEGKARAYNEWIKDHPLFLPFAPEMPEEVLRKSMYGDKRTAFDYFMGGIGMAP
jgi:hypothetical protein